MDASSSKNLDEYSASSTTIKFDSPISLLRGPIPVGPFENPGSGPYVLAFKSHESWATAFSRCRSQITEQCEAGARIGCAISASSKCKPPWWRAMIGSVPTDSKDRELCEEREMEGCFLAAKDKCVELAKEKCSRPFMDARIVAPDRIVSKKLVERSVHLVSMPERSKFADMVGLGLLCSQIMEKCRFGATSFKASDLLVSDTKNPYSSNESI